MENIGIAFTYRHHMGLLRSECTATAILETSALLEIKDFDFRGKAIYGGSEVILTSKTKKIGDLSQTSKRGRSFDNANGEGEEKDSGGKKVEDMGEE
ncbi:hypothetical protein Nepgr_020848 [Nepenthes gracilis]|uniref:Uncharacterized protein n=1 Tax=Nepenthes gracilis TaxID=150966 RepID=A0AAD3SYQ9_NEPGR|nr:hypothetical protein Nepgr_020848 [Nepenthes gracilis]